MEKKREYTTIAIKEYINGFSVHGMDWYQGVFIDEVATTRKEVLLVVKSWLDQQIKQEDYSHA